VTPPPPRIPSTILEFALRDHAVGATILGDLHEAYVERWERGRLRADLWYSYEALTLSATTMMRDAALHFCPA